jgi:hypothetical protein
MLNLCNESAHPYTEAPLRSLFRLGAKRNLLDSSYLDANCAVGSLAAGILTKN